MTERNINYLLDGPPYYPNLHLKVDKGGKFLYCFTLCILKKGKLMELCSCDNYHEKGNHMHFFDPSGELKEKVFNFESISKTIEYFKNNWKDYLGEENE